MLNLAHVKMSAMTRHVFRRRIEWDRKLIQGRFSTVLRIFAIVMCLPLFVWLCLCLLEVAGLFSPDELSTEGGLAIDRPPLWWSVLYHFIDPGNQNMTYGFGRAIGLLLAISGGIFMNGILISSIVGWYDRYVDKWRCGLARYDATLERSRFMVIIGAHESVPSIIRQLLARSEKPDYILIQTNGNVEELRRRVLSFLRPDEERKVVIYAGDRTSGDDLKDLHPEWAMELFILGESIGENCESNRDALNLTALQKTARILAGAEKRASGKKLICRLLFEYQTSFSIFQYSDISNQIRETIDFKPMNFYELWAQRVFVNTSLAESDLKASEYLPLEGERPIGADSEDTVHLVIAGMSRMGVALAIEAAHLAHYPNFVKSAAKRSRITFIDSECGRERRYFQGRFKELFSLCRWREVTRNDSISLLASEEGWHNSRPQESTSHLGKDFIDVEWEFVERGIEEREIHDFLHDAATDPHKRLTVAICLPDDNRSVASAIYLPESVYENAVGVLVYQYHNSAIIDSISRNNVKNLYYRNLKAFGMAREAYSDTMVRTQEKIAAILGSQYGTMYERVKINLSISDVSVKSTRGKSDIAKYWSNLYNANTIWSKLRSIGYCGEEELDLRDVDILSKTEHNRWVMEQLLMRYRALTPEEQKKAAGNLEYKEELKGCKMAHLDICSSERLCEVDPNVTCFDEGFIKILPDIIKSINENG